MSTSATDTSVRVLYVASIQLGMGLTAEIEISEAPPISAPISGHDWPVERDWPLARLIVLLPCDPIPSHHPGARMHPAVVCQHEVLGWPVHGGLSWSEIPNDMQRSVYLARPLLADAVGALRERVELELAPVIAHVRAREARLERRARTFAAGGGTLEVK
jgi:hypothetical protein